MPHDETGTWHRGLIQLPRFGAGIGLHRIAALIVPILGTTWGQHLDAIKVTGSNGKGSVAAMTSAILEAAGITTGLFTSPHFRCLEERVQIGSQAASSALLAASYDWFVRRWRRYDEHHHGEALGAFEAWTAIALHAFAVAGTEAVVAEAGIGGRYDPVRLYPGRCSALVSIDREHASVLGSTVEAIACDKADIGAPGSTLLVGNVSAFVRRAVEERTRRSGVLTWFLDDHVAVEAHRPVADGVVASLRVGAARFHDLKIAAHGRHQVTNAGLAIELASRWLARHRPTFDDDTVRRAVFRGLASVSLPGRFDRVARSPDMFVDVAHTPAATCALAATLVEHLGERRVELVAGVSADKDAEQLLAPLLTRAFHVTVTRAHHHGASSAAVAAAVRRAQPALPCVEQASLAAALRLAQGRARHESRPVLVAGGLFLAAEAAEIMRGGDPKELVFG